MIKKERTQSLLCLLVNKIVKHYEVSKVAER